MGLKDRLRYLKRKSTLKKVDAVLVVSTGRTGTKFFEKFFRDLSLNAVVLHEPKPDFFGFGLDKIRDAFYGRKLTKQLIIIRGILILSLQEQGLLKKGTKYVESNPFLFPILDEYIPVFKSVKIIYITRDPKTYLVSAFNKDPSNDDRNDFYGSSDVRSRLTAADFKEMTTEAWEAFSRQEKIAWYWNKCNSILYDKYKALDENALHVTFEALFSGSMETRIESFKKVISFVEPTYVFDQNDDTLVALSAKKINRSKTLSGVEQFDDFDIEIQRKVLALVAPMSKKIGYL